MVPICQELADLYLEVYSENVDVWQKIHQKIVNDFYPRHMNWNKEV